MIITIFDDIIHVNFINDYISKFHTWTNMGTFNGKGERALVAVVGGGIAGAGAAPGRGGTATKQARRGGALPAAVVCTSQCIMRAPPAGPPVPANL